MDELSKVLEDLHKAITERAGWEESAGEIPQTINDQFNVSFWSRQDPDKNAWAPLKRPPSRATGRMFGEALDVVMRGNVSVEGYWSQLYVDPFYWMFQNYGTSVIPAREFFGVGDDALDEIAEKTATNIENALLEGDFWRAS